MPNLLIVTGLYRSGVNWFTRKFLATSPGVRTDLRFSLLCKYAWVGVADSSRRLASSQAIAKAYQNKLAKFSRAKAFAHACFANLWLSHEICATIPHAKFIVMQRQPLSNCQSILANHAKKALRSKDTPSEYFEAKPPKNIVDRVLFLWAIAANKTRQLIQDYPNQVKLVQFEDLVLGRDVVRKSISEFSGIDVGSCESRLQSLTKWYHLGLDGIRRARRIFDGDSFTTAALESEIDSCF